MFIVHVTACVVIERINQGFVLMQGVMFSSYCLDSNLPHMFYLWGEIFAK